MEQQQQQQSSGGTAPAPGADEPAKRQAFAGQWRTPPLPVFAASSKDQQHQQQPPQQQAPPPQHAPPPQQQQQQHAPQPQVTFVPTALPDSSEDYAMALQEAYRRGAEAAAAMTMGGGAAAPAGTNVMPGAPPAVAQMPTAVSCPNLADLRPSRNVMFADEQQHPQEPSVEVMGEAVPNPLQPPPQQPHQPMQPPPPATTTVHHHHHTMQHMPAGQPVASNAAARSLSLPDMASFAARAQAEEEKRKKRLARNRASARLRRLRKKNLVDSYEGEVGVLESSLQKLKAHEWGNAQDHEALLEALSMERGQQVISSEERALLIKEILEQQRTQVAWIKECQLEQLTLKWLAQYNAEDASQDQHNEEEVQLYKELQDMLQLTDEQKGNIMCSTEGLEQEVTAVETVDDCLKAMQEKDWLLNEGVTAISNQFTSILHPNQISKFLLWTDANAEAIEQLDYCHAPRAISPPASSPIFGFGMDGDYHSGNAGDDDDK